MKNHRKNIILASLSIKLIEVLDKLNEVFIHERPFLENPEKEPVIGELQNLRKPILANRDILLREIKRILI